MGKKTITVSFDEEKLSALKMYLTQKLCRQKKNLKKHLKLYMSKPFPSECVNLLI